MAQFLLFTFYVVSERIPRYPVTHYADSPYGELHTIVNLTLEKYPKCNC